MMAKYPDIEPDTLGELKSIRRLPSMATRPPRIRWGDEYASWPLEQRLRYAERVAAAMNHAADVLQGERDELLRVAGEQEEMLKHGARQYASQGEIINQRLGRENEEKQLLYRDIVRLTAENKALLRRIRELGG